jgi:hypothetical protein
MVGQHLVNIDPNENRQKWCAKSHPHTQQKQNRKPRDNESADLKLAGPHKEVESYV